jgi:hypothetical protein
MSSTITLAQVKADLRLTQHADDAILQVYLDAAEDEALRYMGRTQLPTLPQDHPSGAQSEEVPSSEDPVAPSVYAAVFLLVKAKYEADTPAEIKGLRECALDLLQPYRIGLGV